MHGSENRKSQKQTVHCVIRKTDKQQRRRRRRQSVGGWTCFEGQSSTRLNHNDDDNATNDKIKNKQDCGLQYE